MRDSLVSLLDGVIDYAGLFPPARLAMPAAVGEFLEICDGEDRWIVNRFICSTDGLPVLTAELDRHEIEGFPVVVIGRASNDLAGWQASLEEAASAMNDFNERNEGRAEIDAFEIRVPRGDSIQSWIRDVRGFDEADLFLELPWDPHQSDALAAISELDWLGAKARCGGATADQFPSAAELASFIHGCVAGDVPFKLTAGLHHPFPNRDQSTGAQAHGFVNALAGAVLAYAHDLSRSELADLLRAGAPAFTFENDELVWDGHGASIEQIEEARLLFLGFGSCSVSEPIQDLDQAGLLE